MRFIYAIVLGVYASHGLLSMEKAQVLDLSNNQTMALKRCTLFKDVDTLTVKNALTKTGHIADLEKLALVVGDKSSIEKIKKRAVAAVYFLALFAGAPGEVVGALSDRYYGLIKKKKKQPRFLCVEKIAELVPLCAFPFCYESQINWAERLMERTKKSSWHQWRRALPIVKPELINIDKQILKKDFLNAVAQGTYQLKPFTLFQKGDISGNLLQTYPHAKTPEEAYPAGGTNEETRKRNIAKVYCLMGTLAQLSPICIARVNTREGNQLIKLDGAHRILAAVFRKSNVRVLFIDL